MAYVTCMELHLKSNLKLEWSRENFVFGPRPDQLGNRSNRDPKIESAAVFRLRNILSQEFIVIGIGMSRSRVSLSNLTLSQNKSWSLHLGEGHTKGWDQFDHVWTK